jgi:hypothetical protein
LLCQAPPSAVASSEASKAKTAGSAPQCAERATSSAAAPSVRSTLAGTARDVKRLPPRSSSTRTNCQRKEIPCTSGMVIRKRKRRLRAPTTPRSHENMVARRGRRRCEAAFSIAARARAR